MKKNKTFVFGVGFILACFFVYMSIYTVKIDEQVIITKLGMLIDEPLTEPGIHFKLPILHVINYLPNHRVFELEIKLKSFSKSDSSSNVQLVQWEIGDPVKYFYTYGKEKFIKTHIVEAIDKILSENVEEQKLILDGNTLIRINQLLESRGVKIIAIIDHV
ncbi:MAG: SPFH domain-containing protein [Pseudomonadota bacterium]